MTAKPFAALFDAIAACVQGDAERLRRALAGVNATELFACAVRHKCAGALLHGLADLRIREADLRTLMGMLRRYAGTAALDAQNVRAQLRQIVDVLDAHSVPYALLKGCARLLAGDAITEWTHTADIDVLVPRAAADNAAAALMSVGYRYQFDAATIAGYRRHHQHLAPLLPARAGKPVELHVALMLRSWFSLRCDWEALQGHLEPVSGATHVLQLDGFGRVLHLAMHGVSLYRLGDAMHLAEELRRDPALYSRVMLLAGEERIQRIPLLAVLAAGAEIAGLDAQVEDSVRRYLDWSIVREDLPKWCRGRMQLIDAWFADGGAFGGPATHLAFPPVERYDGTATGVAERLRTMAGRVVAGAAGAALARNVTRRAMLGTR